ncbi:hypothetical protein DIPPA_07804 [Diplonema papillatum]|nr:hypothetical protein DIPPA_07804 [Diplonema papillatum]
MKMSDAPDAGDEPPAKKKKGGKEKGAKSTPSDPLKQRLLAAQRAGDPDGVLAAFREWAAAGGEHRTEAVPAQVLAALQRLLPPGSPALVAGAEEVYSKTVAKLAPATGGEPLLTLMVRAHAAAGDAAKAWEYFGKIPKLPAADAAQRRSVVAAGSARVRSVTPMLEACAAAGDSGVAEAIFYKEIDAYRSNASKLLTDSEELQRQEAIVLWAEAVAADASLSVPAKKRKLDEALRALFAVVPLFKLTSVNQVGKVFSVADGKAKDNLKRIFAACGYPTVHDPVAVQSSGCCPATGVNLRPSRLTPGAIRELRELVESLATENNSPEALAEWAAFKAWLAGTERTFLHVIDGANVGHAYQNKAAGEFSHQQIDAVAAACEAPLVVLREHWLRAGTSLAVRKRTGPDAAPKRKRLPQLLPETVRGAVEGAKAGPDLDEQLREQLGLGGEDPPQQEEEKDGEEGKDSEPAQPGLDEDAQCKDEPAAKQAADEAAEDEAAGDELAAQLLEQLGAASAGGDEAPSVRQQYRAKWEAEGVLLVSPHYINDDWVAMYVALEMISRGAAGVQLVTNDVFRDHFWRMHQHPALATWIHRHLTKFALHDGPAGDGDFVPSPAPQIYRKATLKPPSAYTAMGQLDEAEKCWHVPMNTVPVSWIAAVAD